MKFILILTLCVVGAIASPSTAEEASLIRAKWDQVKHNEVDILYTVFKTYPEIQDKFPQFVGKDLESIKDSPEFAIQSTRIFSLTSEIVSMIGNPAVQSSIDSLIVKMAKEHKARGVTKELFNKFNVAFMGYLRAHTTWDEKTENAWNVVGEEQRAIVFSILDE